MDLLILAILIAAGTFMLNAKEQRKRIVLLGRHLANYQIEQLMQALTDGYLRALGESTDERRSQIWSLLGTKESQLSEQFDLFAADFSKVDKAHNHVSRLALRIPFTAKIFPGRTFDLRRLLSILARGIAHVVQNTYHLSPKERAYMMMAELFLMQHSCHWFCKSKAVATARMLARHQRASSLAWSYTGCAGRSARCRVSAQCSTCSASPSTRTRLRPALGMSLWRGPASPWPWAVRQIMSSTPPWVTTSTVLPACCCAMRRTAPITRVWNWRVVSPPGMPESASKRSHRAQASACAALMSSTRIPSTTPKSCSRKLLSVSASMQACGNSTCRLGRAVRRVRTKSLQIRWSTTGRSAARRSARRRDCSWPRELRATSTCP